MPYTRKQKGLFAAALAGKTHKMHGVSHDKLEDMLHEPTKEEPKHKKKRGKKSSWRKAFES